MSRHHRSLLRRHQDAVRHFRSGGHSWARAAIYAADADRRAGLIFGQMGHVLSTACLKTGYTGPLHRLAVVAQPIPVDDVVRRLIHWRDG